MLERTDQDDFDHIVSWLPSENGFKVHDSKAFVATVLPRFFRQTKYKSFQRQCNIWGFERILQGPHKGGYTHVDFIRGKTNLCSRMKRQKIKGGGVILPSAPIAGSGSESSSASIGQSNTPSIPIASYHSGSVDSPTDAAARSISPSGSIVIIVEGRNYNSPKFSSSKVISAESLSKLDLHAPNLIHTVPVSPVPEAFLPSPDTATVAASPQTGDSINFEGQNYFYIHDAEFAASTNNDDLYMISPPATTADGGISRNHHHRRLSLDLFAASLLENDEHLVGMLIAADASPTADFSLTSSSYFY